MKYINSQADINVSRILRLIWQQNGISRIEIASKLGLDKSTVTKIVFSLLEVGIVAEVAHGSTGPQGGRKPIYLEITSSFALVGGIEINASGFVCSLLNLQGELLFQHEQKMTVADTLDCFNQAYTLLCDESKKRKINMIGVGVGLSGIVNSDSGFIIKSIPLNIGNNFPFSQIASSQVGVPVFVENDARCCCYSEQTLLHDTGMQNILFILIELRNGDKSVLKNTEVSVGMGLVLNGKIYKGSAFSAGEFSSMLWNGEQSCQFCSEEENLEEFGKNEASLKGDEDTIFSELARHAAFLVNTLNLETVYIGGLPTELAEELAKLISHRIECQWPYEGLHCCEVKLSSLGSLAVAYGAAGMFIDRFFALPSLSTPSGNGPSILESLSLVGTTGMAGKLV